MPKTKISEYSTVNTDNSDIESINIAEGCAPSGINNAIRELMVHLKEFQTGASGDAFTFAGGVLISGSLNTATGAMIMTGANNIALAAGAVGTPSLYANGDTNTGIFFPAADTIAFAEGGAEAMRIDSSGRLIVGNTSSNADFGSGIQLQNSGFSSNILANRFDANASGPSLFLAKSRSGTIGTNTIVQSGDTTGNIGFYGANGTGYSPTASILSAVDGTPGASNDMPGRLVFSTTADGSGDLTERMRIDSSGNLALGNTSAYRSIANYIFQTINGTNASGIDMGYGGARKYSMIVDSGGVYLTNASNTPMTFSTNDTERARITSGGDFCINTTSSTVSGLTSGYITVDLSNGAKHGFNVNSLAENYSAIGIRKHNTSGTSYPMYIVNSSGSAVGSISMTNSATAFNTSSDYRLKENIAPMTGALEKIAQLKPVTYTWKEDGSAGQGFIAHELQEVVPDCVTGEKDATEIRQVEVSPAISATYDEEGNELTPAVEAVYEEREVPRYQGVDTSFLVATLTAAIQELAAKNDALEARLATLEAK